MRAGDAAPESLFPAAHELSFVDSPEVARRVDAYRRRIIRSSTEQAALPFFLATISFAAMFANYAPRVQILSWLVAVLALLGLRIFSASKHFPAGGHFDRNWEKYNTLALAGLGCLYGITPLWLSGSGDIWLLAVANLWLGGLAVAVLLSQGIVATAGLAFAIPTVAPLLCILLFAGDPTETLMGLGNVILFTYLYSIIRRTRTAILHEARHRVMLEQVAQHYDEQRLRSAKLVEDLTEEIERRKQAEAALRDARDAAEMLSNEDHLTGLSTRRAFDDTLSREWSRAVRGRIPLSLIVCEIDRFTEYNDIYGKRAGEQCLVRISEITTAGIKRAGDFAARCSENQLCLLLPDTSEASALEIAETIRQRIFDQTILHAGADVTRIITASFGVATVVPAAPDAQANLIEAADHALGRARRGGGNCVFAVYGDIANDER